MQKLNSFINSLQVHKMFTWLSLLLVHKLSSFTNSLPAHKMFTCLSVPFLPKLSSFINSLQVHKMFTWLFLPLVQKLNSFINFLQAHKIFTWLFLPGAQTMELIEWKWKWFNSVWKYVNVLTVYLKTEIWKIRKWMISFIEWGIVKYNSKSGTGNWVCD